MESLIII